MRKMLLVLIGLSIGGAYSVKSHAANTDEQYANPQELLEDATRNVILALELIIGSIPQYHLPEVLENGDIIIRRVQSVPKSEPMPPPSEGEVSETST